MLGGVAIGAGEIVVKISAGQVFYSYIVYMFHHVSIVVQFPLYHPLLVAEIQPPWSPWSQFFTHHHEIAVPCPPVPPVP